MLIAKDNPFDSNQAIPVLLAVLLNNPNLKEGSTFSGTFLATEYPIGLRHSILNGAVLGEFACVDRSDRARAIEWLKHRRSQACDDAVRIAQQQWDSISAISIRDQMIAQLVAVIADRDRAIDELKAEIQQVRGCSVNAFASAVCTAFSSKSQDESDVSSAVCF